MAEPAPRTLVVLASASPRRLDLLRRLGIEPVVRAADIDERVVGDETPTAHVRRLARAKADVTDAPEGAVVIAADTVVVHRGHILGKPADAADAAAMLSRLSGDTHEVLTGVALRRGGRHAETVESTTVRFRPVSAEEIDAYVATGEPLDKAGAYAIQGGAGAFVVSIEGSDTNVIGLPLAAVVRLADEVGVTIVPR